MSTDEKAEEKVEDNPITSRVNHYINNILFGQALFDIPKPAPLIEGMFDLESMVFLYAEPKAYKSFMALDWALSVATGRPWNGREVSKQKVLYVAAEGASGIPQRIQAWMERNTPLAKLPPDNFALLKIPVPMGNDIDADAISTIAVTLGFKFIILDTLARCSAGMDENSTKDMGALVENADRIKRNSGACVLWVHHSGKSDKNDLRGSSSLKGAADSIFKMKKSGTGQVTLYNPEQKNMAETEDSVFVVTPTGDSLVLVCPTRGNLLTEFQKKALAALSKAMLENNAPVKLADWGRACGIDSVGNSKPFRTAREKLVNTGFVTESDGLFQVAS